MRSTSSSGTGPSNLQRGSVALLLLSIVVFTFALQFLSIHVKQTRKRNRVVRNKLFKRLGLEVKGVPRRTVIGFFHPYCNAGGGGERVLWQAIEYHLRQDSNAVVVVYSGDVGESAKLEPSKRIIQSEAELKTLPDGALPATKQEILAKCRERFGIPLNEDRFSSRIWLLPLANRAMVSDSYWKRLTLLGQSYGSVRLAFEACTQLLPDVWIDTMGYAFSYPLVRLFDRRLPIGGYVHYPTISTDMLQRVRNQEAGHTNSTGVSSSKLRSRVKLLYYNIFAACYSWALRSSNVLVANGSWTQNHVNRLVLGSKATSKAAASNARYVQVVFPPCDTGSLVKFPLAKRETQSIVSLAQFRPEKEHSTQVRIIAALVAARRQAGKPTDKIHLCCMGSSRNKDDEHRIEELKALVKELGVEQHVSFVVNAPYSAILDRLSTSSIGLSTMVDEHFGINVVEFMAAGLITLSHASAGPLLDIAVPSSSQSTGFHATALDDFVDRLQMILDLKEEQQLAIREAARRRAVDVFSNDAFCQSWQAHLWSRLSPTEASKKTQ